MALLTGIITGILFGTVLYKVGAVRYSRVIGMLTMKDNKIMKFAFTTIATSSALYGLAAIFNIAEPLGLVPRVMPYLGVAHIIGGVIFGVTMAWVGFCPGACVARAGANLGEEKFTALSGLIGLFVGVLLFGLIKQPLINSGILLERPIPMTLHGLLGVSYGPLALVLASFFVFLAVLADRLGTEKIYESASQKKSLIHVIRSEWNWVSSGIAAGVIIVLSTMQGGYLGFSGSALAALAWAGDLFGASMELVPRVNEAITWRAGLLVGLVPGALLASKWSIQSKAFVGSASTPKILKPSALLKSFTGGTALSLGAMIGGGCTTGAFMAAFPTLSIGSFAMAGTFFIVSKATSFILFNGWKSPKLQEMQVMGDKIYN